MLHEISVAGLRNTGQFFLATCVTTKLQDKLQEKLPSVT